MENQAAATPNAPIVQQSKSNGMGIAGFVLAICALVFCWVPILNWILWILGVVFSMIGVFRMPRGLAIAGLAISTVYIILVTIVLSAVLSLTW